MKRHSFRLAAAALGLLLVLPTGLPASAASSFDAGSSATRMGRQPAARTKVPCCSTTSSSAHQKGASPPPGAVPVTRT